MAADAQQAELENLEQTARAGANDHDFGDAGRLRGNLGQTHFLHGAGASLGRAIITHPERGPLQEPGPLLQTTPRAYSRRSRRNLGGVVTNLNVNGNAVEVDVDPETPLLWVLRDTLGLTGTKFGCGMALCGACTVHLAGQPVRSCQIPVSAVGEQAVTTIEGLSKDRSHPVQEAWIEHDVPQCG